MANTGVLDYETETGPDGETLDEPVPMTCTDCGRPALYDYLDERYHHAIDCARGCYLIPGEDRLDDADHPLVGVIMGLHD